MVFYLSLAKTTKNKYNNIVQLQNRTIFIGLMEDTPDHSYFGKLRKRINPERLAEIFHKVNEAMKKQNLFGKVFTLNLCQKSLICHLELVK